MALRQDRPDAGTTPEGTRDPADGVADPSCISEEELLELATVIHAGDRRFLIGLTGPPGSGKSTLATRLTGMLRPSPPVVPMDGFHLAQAEIDRRGLADRKGAPETFDPWRFLCLLTRIATPAQDDVVRAPAFDRDIEEPVPDVIPVEPAAGLVIVEGNYLLLGESPWVRIRPALDLCAYLELEDATRRSRLVERHVRYGKNRLAAERFVRDSDEKNARLVKATRDRADIIVLMDL